MKLPTTDASEEEVKCGVKIPWDIKVLCTYSVGNLSYMR